MTEDQAVKDLLEAVTKQSEFLMSFATAGLAGTVFAISRVFNIASSEGTLFRKFKFGELLIAPLLLFVLAQFFGYLIVSSVQGYFTELVTKPELLAKYQGDFGNLYQSEYYVAQNIFQMAQIALSIGGYFFLLIWYGANIFSNIGGKD